MMSRGVNSGGRGITVSGRGVDVGAVATTTTIEDWERANPLDDYTANSDISNFAIQQSTVQEGNNALEYQLSGGSFDSIEATASELPGTAPSQGDEFTVRHRLESDDDVRFFFGLDSKGGVSSGSMYTVEILDLSRMRIRRYDTGSVNNLASSTGLTIPQNEWLTQRVDWQTDGTIVYELQQADGTQIDQISTTDTTYTSGGIGWFANDRGSGMTAYSDLAQIL